MGDQQCKESYWAPEDRSVGIMGPTLDDCGAKVCPFGNDWEDYENDKIDWDGEDSEWD